MIFARLDWLGYFRPRFEPTPKKGVTNEALPGAPPDDCGATQHRGAGRRDNAGGFERDRSREASSEQKARPYALGDRGALDGAPRYRLDNAPGPILDSGRGK